MSTGANTFLKQQNRQATFTLTLTTIFAVNSATIGVCQLQYLTRENLAIFLPITSEYNLVSIALTTGNTMRKLLLGASALALTACAGSALAQEVQNEVIVTGTRTSGLKAVDSAAPVQVLDAGSLKRAGQPDLMQSLAENVPLLHRSSDRRGRGQSNPIGAPARPKP